MHTQRRGTRVSGKIARAHAPIPTSNKYLSHTQQIARLAVSQMPRYGSDAQLTWVGLHVALVGHARLLKQVKHGGVVQVEVGVGVDAKVVPRHLAPASPRRGRLWKGGARAHGRRYVTQAARAHQLPLCTMSTLGEDVELEA